MGALSPTHLIIILIVVLVVFGPKKLPEIGKGLGSALREFSKAKDEFMESIHAEATRPEPPVSSTVAAPSVATAQPALTASSDTTAAHTAAGAAPASPDALPYGGEFHPEGDSQPSFRGIPSASTPPANPGHP